MIVTSSSNWRIPHTQNEVPLQIKTREISHYLKDKHIRQNKNEAGGLN
jgi:hypothetical protein